MENLSRRPTRHMHYLPLSAYTERDTSLAHWLLYDTSTTRLTHESFVLQVNRYKPASADKPKPCNERISDSQAGMVPCIGLPSKFSTNSLSSRFRDTGMVPSTIFLAAEVQHKQPHGAARVQPSTQPSWQLLLASGGWYYNINAQTHTAGVADQCHAT